MPFDDIKDREITIDLNKYNELIWKANMFDMLTDVLFGAARLDYTGKELVFDDPRISLFLRGINAFHYESKLHELGGKING